MEIISYTHLENKLKVAILFSMADGYKLRIEDSESSLSDVTFYLTSDGELDDISYCLPQTDTELLSLDWARESIQKYKASILYLENEKK